MNKRYWAVAAGTLVLAGMLIWNVQVIRAVVLLLILYLLIMMVVQVFAVLAKLKGWGRSKEVWYIKNPTAEQVREVWRGDWLGRDD